MSPTLDLASKLIVFGLLVTVGFDVTREALARVAARPGLVAAGVLLPPLLLPALAVALIACFEPEPALAAGLLLLATCPIGGLANIYTHLAGASSMLSITMTAVSLVCAFVTIPAATLVVERVWQYQAPYAVPAGVLTRELLTVLGPPLLIGAVIRAVWPAWVERHRTVFQRVGIGTLVILIALVIADSMSQPMEAPGTAVLLAACFVTGGFGLGWAVASVLRTTPQDRFAVAAEFATRNVPVSLAIALMLASQAAFTWFAAVYLAVELPLAAVAVAAFRRRWPTTAPGTNA